MMETLQQHTIPIARYYNNNLLFIQMIPAVNRNSALPLNIMEQQENQKIPKQRSERRRQPVQYNGSLISTSKIQITLQRPLDSKVKHKLDNKNKFIENNIIFTKQFFNKNRGILVNKTNKNNTAIVEYKNDYTQAKQKLY